MYKAKKVACVNDLSGYGRCSLTTAIAVISALSCQCCPVPTAILSSHTGFENYFFKDMTKYLKEYLQDWINKKIAFDAVYTGFLGSFAQVDIVSEFIKEQRKINENLLVIIDTVMGDNGKIYSTYTDEMCFEMRKLVALADVITPNVTESCYLTDTPYGGEEVSKETAQKLSEKLLELGCRSVVITGIKRGNSIVNLVNDNGEITEIFSKKTNEFSGTGDLFASTLTGFLLGGKSLDVAVEMASSFIFEALENTIGAGTDVREGIVFEPTLKKFGGQ